MAKKEISDLPYLIIGTMVAIEEEIEKVADSLVDKGRSLTPEGRQKAAAAKKGLVAKGDEFSQVVARTVQRVLENAGLVTRDDLEDLDGRVNDVEKRLVAKKKKAVAVKPAKKKAGKKPAKKKAAKKKAGKKPAKKKAAKKPAKKKTGK